MFYKKLTTLLFIILILTIPTACGDTDVYVEELEVTKPQNVTTEEVTGEVEIERIDSFKNVKGGFTNYNVKFVGVEFPTAVKYEEAHVAMFHSTSLGIAIHKRLIQQGTKIPATFTIKKVDDVIKNVTIKEIKGDF